MVDLAGNLRAVWLAPSTDARLKKRIVRTLIHEVVADLDDAPSEIVLVIHWVGGVHTELRLPKRRRGQRNATPDDIVEAVWQLVRIANDDVIAGILNRNGLTTGNGNRWTRERVTALRSYRKIPVFRPQADGSEPWLNLGKAAKLLGITPKTLRIAAEAGEIEGVRLLQERPWIFSRQALHKPAAQDIVHRARQNPKYPTGSHPDQGGRIAREGVDDGQHPDFAIRGEFVMHEVHGPGFVVPDRFTAILPQLGAATAHECADSHNASASRRPP